MWLKTPAQASDSACFAMSGAHGPKKAKIFFVDAAVREKLGHSMHERVYSNAFREAGVSTLRRVCFSLVALMSNLWLKRSKTALEIR